MFFNKKRIIQIDPSIRLYIRQTIQQSTENIITREKKKHLTIVNTFVEKKNMKKHLYGFYIFSLYTFFQILFHKKYIYSIYEWK